MCAVAGVIDVSPGVGRIPPEDESNGAYTFNHVALACVGATNAPLGPTTTGLGTITSSGGFGAGYCSGTATPLVGSFCGSYNATFGGGGCAGTVGGREAELAGYVAAGRWSLVVGPLLLGGLTCSSGSYGPDGVGVLALVAAPNVSALDGYVLGTDLPPGECPQPPPFPRPDPSVPDDPAAVWACQIIVAGVAVIANV
ncbi:MAG TPA: hypothetical protein VF230_16865 [Acidimicrobiales bacterium]